MANRGLGNAPFTSEWLRAPYRRIDLGAQGDTALAVVMLDWLLEDAVELPVVQAGGDLLLPMLQVTGGASVQVEAGGGVLLPRLLMSGSAAVRVDAGGAVELPMIAIDASASVMVEAGGELLLPTLSIEGSATVGPVPVTPPPTPRVAPAHGVTWRARFRGR